MLRKMIKLANSTHGGGHNPLQNKTNSSHQKYHILLKY